MVHVRCTYGFFTGPWAKENQLFLSRRGTSKPEMQVSYHVHTSEEETQKSYPSSIHLKAYRSV